MLIVGMTSLPSRLEGARVALESIVAQTVMPDRLILSLPRMSLREGRSYELPKSLVKLLSEHSWMQVHWLEDDFGPGTKLLGVADWFQSTIGQPIEGDMLMLLDDDHAYVPHAIGELWQKQKSLGTRYVSSFFAYFFRGIMVPQGADIVAVSLESSTLVKLKDFHRRFVLGDSAAFLVDDLWCAMFYFLSGKEVRSFREDVIKRGLETIYTRTANASVEALMDLGGSSRRDRVMLQCFQGLLRRLLDCDPNGLEVDYCNAVSRLRRLALEAHQADGRIDELTKWLFSARDGTVHCDSHLLLQATQELNSLRNLYLMQAPLPEDQRVIKNSGTWGASGRVIQDG